MGIAAIALVEASGNNISVVGEIKYPGIIEGGDIIWINKRTIAVGEGYRTNKEGIQQLKDILGKEIDEIIPVPLPHWLGPKSCLHLMSNVSPIDHNLFLIYNSLKKILLLLNQKYLY